MKINLAILVSVSLFLTGIFQAAKAGQLKRPTPCGSTQHRAFDFWIGEWEVRDRGKSLYLDGEFNDSTMVLSDDVNRISWSINNKNEINQIWETTKDKGKTWKIIFDGIYRKIKTK